MEKRHVCFNISMNDCMQQTNIQLFTIDTELTANIAEKVWEHRAVFTKNAERSPFRSIPVISMEKQHKLNLRAVSGCRCRNGVLNGDHGSDQGGLGAFKCSTKLYKFGSFTWNSANFYFSESIHRAFFERCRKCYEKCRIDEFCISAFSRFLAILGH